MRPTRDAVFLQMAALIATRSTCLRRAVGCVLVSARGHVLATGYNGVAAGLPHCNDYDMPRNSHPHPNACAGALRADGKRWPSGHNLDACEAIHAEQNALLQCRDVWQIRTCYVTVSPCMTCTKLLLGTSCTRVIFSAEYPAPGAKELWLRNQMNSWEKHR
jgi:dCMP deaminase